MTHNILCVQKLFTYSKDLFNHKSWIIYITTFLVAERQDDTNNVTHHTIMRPIVSLKEQFGVQIPFQS